MNWVKVFKNVFQQKYGVYLNIPLALNEVALKEFDSKLNYVFCLQGSSLFLNAVKMRFDFLQFCLEVAQSGITSNQCRRKIWGSYRPENKISTASVISFPAYSDIWRLLVFHFFTKHTFFHHCSFTFVLFTNFRSVSLISILFLLSSFKDGIYSRIGKIPPRNGEAY